MNTALEVIPAVVLDSPWTQDEQDRLWLSEKTATVEQGLRSVADAVIQITKNWTAGRKVGRFHPDLTAYEYLIAEIGPVRLPREERDQFIAGLIEAGHSRRKAAKLAGVSPDTAQRAVRNRTPRRQPTDGGKLAKHIRGILAAGSTLPGELDRWLATDPPEDERTDVAEDLADLADRVAALIEKVTP